MLSPIADHEERERREDADERQDARAGAQDVRDVRDIRDIRDARGSSGRAPSVRPLSSLPSSPSRPPQMTQWAGSLPHALPPLPASDVSTWREPASPARPAPQAPQSPRASYPQYPRLAQVPGASASARSRIFPARSRVLILVGLIAYALLNLGDLLTTRVGLTMGLREGNPLMSRLLHAYGFNALIFYKVLVVVFVTCGVIYLMRHHVRIAALTLTLCSLLVGAAVVLNLIQFIRY